MAKITEGNETVTVNTNSAEQEAGLKALCDGFNAQKEMRQEATILTRGIRHEMRRIERAYTAGMKPKDDLPAEIAALSLLTASLEDLRESLRELLDHLRGEASDLHMTPQRYQMLVRVPHDPYLSQKM